MDANLSSTSLSEEIAQNEECFSPQKWDIIHHQTSAYSHLGRAL